MPSSLPGWLQHSFCWLGLLEYRRAAAVFVGKTIWQLILKVFSLFGFVVFGVFLCTLFPLSPEFCSPERWAVADGDVGVEAAWYFLGRYSCTPACSSPSLTWPCSRSSTHGGAESTTAAFGMKNASFRGGGGHSTG